MCARWLFSICLLAASLRAQTIRNFMQTVQVRAHAVDPAGNIYLAGLSTHPLGIGTVQPTLAGGVFDAFVAKWTPDGTRLIYATNLGGSSSEAAEALAVDAAGTLMSPGTRTREIFL